jgi:hypothetical protein
MDAEGHGSGSKYLDGTRGNSRAGEVGRGEVLSTVEGGTSWKGNAVNGGGRIGWRWVGLAHRLRQSHIAGQSLKSKHDSYVLLPRL